MAFDRVKMLTIKHLLTLTLISVLTSLAAQEEHQGLAPCGGRLKGPVGVIQTPNFPHAFPVPIKCRWVIEHELANGTISVYFTQQFTTSGLTFTEYMYYDDTYKLGERRALTVTEENITRVKWLQVQSPVLVVELTLGRLEGSQLRALGLLGVFGFNVTYAVRAPDAAPPRASCSAIECRLLGHCYATRDYQEFFCACFEGYSGADCGTGPLCPRAGMCHNGGTCRQMGPASVSCVCAPGYTGDFCETTIDEPECGIEECADRCRSDKCDCNPKESDSSTASFDARLQVVADQANVNISSEVVRQISKHSLTANISLEDEIEVLNISDASASGTRTVRVRIWFARRDAGALRAALSRLGSTRTRTDHLRFIPDTLHLDMQPALTLHELIINQRPEVWEGSEFILTCMANGSPDIAFTWYKDGVKVNFNGTTRDIWTRTVSEDALGRRISVLGVSGARSGDGGRWSCAALAAGRRRCRALSIAVRSPPDVRLLPSATTVNKGDNISITCLAGASKVHGILGFSWAKERNLLRLAPGREVWEDLYPAGSVLKLYNIQKSGEFRCQVSSVVGTSAKEVTIWALGNNDPACVAEESNGLKWPTTAPGAFAIAHCPLGQVGETKRFCEPKTGYHGVRWKSPDFSECLSVTLKEIYNKFTLLSEGYSWGNVSNIVRQYGTVLRSLPSHPGGGTIPLYHVTNILHYLLSAAGKMQDRRESVTYLLKIYDILLKHPDAFLDEENIYNLQNIIVDTASMRNDLELYLQEFEVKTKAVKDVTAAHFKFYKSISGADEWVLSSAGAELVSKVHSASVVAVQYNDLTSRLPSLKRLVEFESGRETELVLASRQIQLWASTNIDKTVPHTVTLLFDHVKNYSTFGSKVACGLRTPFEPRSWSTKACEVRVSEPSHVSCRCRGLGTYALFIVTRTLHAEADQDLHDVVNITVGVGGALCLCSAVLQILALAGQRGVGGKLARLLSAGTGGTHAAALLVLLQCDEVGSAGWRGWTCSACWCAASATLCARPLILQAELAPHPQRTPSVALLAGFSILVWLMARLWGGDPLELGSGAQVVWAVGCCLLNVLCIALALCAASRLKTIKHKLSAERATYLKDRARVVRHSAALALTTAATQATGVVHAQRVYSTPHLIAFCATALSNGVAMLVCNVIRDDECLRSVRRVLCLGSHMDWEDAPGGDTSLSLYIKQGGEVESRGGVDILESLSSPVSPATSYWRAPGLESPARLNRRQSTPDSMADIVQCVEYSVGAVREARYSGGFKTLTHATCDLIPRAHVSNTCSTLAAHPRGYSTLPVRHRSNPHQISRIPPNYSVCVESFQIHQPMNISRETCSICVQSNPDISKVPIKSCLKKPKKLTSSTSLPSIEITEDSKLKSDMDKINQEWNKAYELPATKVLNKISNDLKFLLNKKPEISDCDMDQIDEAPS